MTIKKATRNTTRQIVLRKLEETILMLKTSRIQTTIVMVIAMKIMTTMMTMAKMRTTNIGNVNCVRKFTLRMTRKKTMQSRKQRQLITMTMLLILKKRLKLRRFT